MHSLVASGMQIRETSKEGHWVSYWAHWVAAAAQPFAGVVEKVRPALRSDAKLQMRLERRRKYMKLSGQTRCVQTVGNLAFRQRHVNLN